MANTRAPRKGRRYAEIGERLEHIRTIILNYTGAQMAKALGTSQSAWSAYETGTRRISLNHALRLYDLIAAALMRHPDVLQPGLDYIYKGELYPKGGGVRLRVKSKKQTR